MNESWISLTSLKLTKYQHQCNNTLKFHKNLLPGRGNMGFVFWAQHFSVERKGRGHKWMNGVSLCQTPTVPVWTHERQKECGGCYILLSHSHLNMKSLSQRTGNTNETNRTLRNGVVMETVHCLWSSFVNGSIGLLLLMRAPTPSPNSTKKRAVNWLLGQVLCQTTAIFLIHISKLLSIRSDCDRWRRQHAYWHVPHPTSPYIAAMLNSEFPRLHSCQDHFRVSCCCLCQSYAALQSQLGRSGIKMESFCFPGPVE